MKGSRYVVGGKGIRAYLMVFACSALHATVLPGTSTRCYHPSPWVASARPGSGGPVSGCERHQNGFGEPVDWPLLGGGCGGDSGELRRPKETRCYRGLSHTHRVRLSSSFGRWELN